MTKKQTGNEPRACPRCGKERYSIRADDEQCNDCEDRDELEQRAWISFASAGAKQNSAIAAVAGASFMLDKFRDVFPYPEKKA